MTSTTHSVDAGPAGKGKVPAPATEAGPARGSDPSNGFLATAALITVGGSVLGLVAWWALSGRALSAPLRGEAAR
ncbi:hypothetical protein [Streptomyces sp. NPDC051214]|uniref:hypothetical protein n=1 Tax=Streptomyces sp. NPDC051214 TaxID=3155282 RepID=UPI00343D6F13